MQQGRKYTSQPREPSVKRREKNHMRFCFEERNLYVFVCYPVGTQRSFNVYLMLYMDVVNVKWMLKQRRVLAGYNDLHKRQLRIC